MASESTTDHASSPTRSRVLVTLSAVSLDRIHRWCGHSGRGLPTDGGYPAIAPVTESHGLIKTKPTKAGLVHGMVGGLVSVDERRSTVASLIRGMDPSGNSAPPHTDTSTAINTR